MLRSIALSLVVAFSAPVSHLSAQAPLQGSVGGAPAAPEVVRASQTLYSAMKRGDRATVMAHLEEEVTGVWGQSSYSGKQDVLDHWFAPTPSHLSDWSVVQDYFDDDGGVVLEVGSYSRLVPTGPCPEEPVEPKRERQGLDPSACGTSLRADAYFQEQGIYRVTWRRSPEGGWRVQRVELEGRL